MARKAKTGGTRRRRTRRTDEAPKRRSRFLEGVTTINEADFEFMRQFVTEHGKIIPARLTGASAKQQRQIKRGVRKARVMGLIA